MVNAFKNLCTPAKIYFSIAILSIIFGLFTNIHGFALFAKLIFAFIYTYFLNFLCNKGYKNVSWFLVVLPYVVMLFVIINVLRMMKK